MASATPPQRFDNDGPRPYRAIPTHGDCIRWLEYLPDGRRVVTGSCSKTVRVWNLESREEGTLMEHEKDITDLAATRDGTKIVSSEWSGRIKVWDVKSHELGKEWTHPESCPTVAISPNNRLIAVGGWSVAICTMEGKQVNRSIKIGRKAWSMCFSPDGNKLACGTIFGTCVYDVASGTLVLGPLNRHWVRVVLWSRDGARLFCGSEDGTICCWNSDTGQQIGQAWTGHARGIRSLSLSPDGSILASASLDRTVRFWNATTGDKVRQHLQHESEVNAVRFSPSGEFVASAGADRKIYLWRIPWLNLIMHQPPQLDHSPVPVHTGERLPSTRRPLIPSALPIPRRTFSPVLGRLRKRRVSNFNANFRPPPDLTPYIVKADDQYVAGGGFGDVYRCWYRDDLPKEVAVKAFRFKFAIDGDASRSAKMLRRELGIWRRLDHVNVVPFLGIAYGFGMRDAMSLVSLWMPNESLHHFLGKHDQSLGLEHRLRFLLDIANGLHYLHYFPIVHGDLNCNNVLLDADYTARLADFGYASLVGNIPEALTYLQRSTARPGALRWIAPEQVDPEEAFNKTTKTDIYSFGCVSLQVLSGKEPWSEVRGESAIVLRLAKGDKPGRPESRTLNDSHWNLIQDCWSAIEERPAAEAIIPTIEHFLGHCPQSPPLCDLLPTWSSEADLGAESSLSVSKTPSEGSRTHVTQAVSDENDQNSIASLSDAPRLYQPHESEPRRISLAGKRSRFRTSAAEGGERRHQKKRQRV